MTTSKVQHAKILVDRLWPRGMAKAEAPFDQWLKMSLPARNFASGMDMFRNALRNSVVVTETSLQLPQLATRSSRCARQLGSLVWCSSQPPETSSTPEQLCSAR